MGYQMIQSKFLMIWMDMLYRALINMAVTALFPRKDYIGPLVLITIASMIVFIIM